MQFIIIIEILFAPVKFKLNTNDIIISSVCLIVFCCILILYFNYLLKISSSRLYYRYEKSNNKLAYSINSILLDHSSFSSNQLKSYAGFPAQYLDNLKVNSKTILNFTEFFKSGFMQNQNLFYELNMLSQTSLKTFKEGYITEIDRAVTTYKYYDLQASLMKMKVMEMKQISVSANEGISTLQIKNHSEEIQQLNEKLFLIKLHLDKYTYLLNAAHSNYETLGSLKTDDLRYEAHLVMQQLFDTFHNYGDSIYSLLSTYYSQINLALNEFAGRNSEYLIYLDYFKIVSELRKKRNIDANAKIVLTNIIEIDGDIFAVKTIDSKADFYILQFRKDIQLFPINMKSEKISSVFNIELAKDSEKQDMLEPALCRKLTDEEYKIINKGIIKIL